MSEQKPKRPLWRRALRAFAWTSAGLVALVVVAIIFLHTPWGKEVVRSRVEGALQKRVTGKLEIGGLDYTFLFGEVSLAEVRITDAGGAPAIEVEQLSVDLDRGSLIAGEPVLERVAISGVGVTIAQNADGTSNLTGLFVKSKRKKSHIEIRAISLADTSVRITKPDGTVIAVTGVSLDGHASINSITATHAVELGSLGASIAVRKPDGTEIAVPQVGTALTARVVDGAIEVKLAPIDVSASIARPGRAPTVVKIGLGATSLSRAGGRIRAGTRSIALGPLRIDALDVDATLDDGQLRGEQSIEISGLHIAHAELEQLLGRPVLATDIDGSISVRGPTKALVVDGVLETRGGRIEIDGVLDATRLDHPVYELAIVGSDLRTAELTRSENRPSLESTLKITANGHGIPRRAGSLANVSLRAGASVVTVRGKAIAIDGVELEARIDGAAIEITRLVARAFGVVIGASARLGETRQLTAQVEIDGNPRRAASEVRKLGIKVRPLPLPTSLSLRVAAEGHLDGDISVAVAPTSIAMAGGNIRVRSLSAELSRASGKPRLLSADADVGLERLSIAALARLAKRETNLAGRLDGEIELRQRGPARRVGYQIRARLEEPEIDVAAKGVLTSAELVIEAEARSRELGSQVASIDARVPLTTSRGARTIAASRALAIDIVVPRRTFAELDSILPPRIAGRLKQRASAGAFEARIALRGSARRPTGTIAIDASAEPTAVPGQRVEIDLDAELSPTSSGRVSIATAATAKVAGVDGELIHIGGGASIGALFRRGVLDPRAAIRAAELALEVDVPERPLASLAPLRPKLAKLPGNIVVRATARGAPRDPRLDVALDWTELVTARGQPSRISVAARGGLRKLDADVTIGAQKQVTINAAITRSPDNTVIAATATAKKVDLASVLPAGAEAAGIVEAHGVLDWDMTANVALGKKNGGTAVTRLELRGALDISGARVRVPRSERRIRDIALRVEGDGNRVRLARLEAHETDIEKEDRSLSLTGEVALEGGRPADARLAISTRDWLVFGGSSGQPDAPRGTASADIDLVARLGGETPEIDVTVRRLDLLEPDRFVREHGLEDFASGGDVFFLGESDVPLGKLAPPRDAGESIEVKKKRLAMAIHVHIPDPIHILKLPLDIRLSGDLDVSMGERGVVPDGVLTVHGGQVDLFGHKHDYESGVIRFDAEHPKGELNLLFAKPLPPATLRELSRASGGMAVKILIEHDILNRKITLLGAGNSGMLEVMSAHNAGRSYYTTEPDLPATASVQAPRGEQPLVLTFLATNLPHMLVLKRFGAWSDPYDDRHSYNRVEHIDGERAATDDRSRVRVLGRPRTLGRSGLELHYDRLLLNTSSIAIGAGLRAGSRLGGGVGLFLEWSSED